MEAILPLSTEPINIERNLHDRRQQPHQHHASTPPRTSTIATPSTPPEQSKEKGPFSSSSMAYQHKHALHRLRRLKKRSPHRDLVISFVPRLRTSIINRLDFFNRYSKQEQEVLSCFDFLDELVLAYCDGSLDSPQHQHNMIYEFIQ